MLIKNLDFGIGEDMRKILGKIKYFMIVYLILLIMGLIVGPTGDYTLSDIPVGIMVLSPFALLSSRAIIKDINFDTNKE